MSKLTLTFTPKALGLSFKPPTLGLSTEIPVVRELVERDPYTGPVVVTPSAEEQTLSTKNLRMTDDVVINPIPSYYGLITWDGSIMVIS